MVESIAGKTGTRVDNLTITTNTEQILTGGGDKGDTLMSWRHEPNTILIGFRGRAGAELDALQPICPFRTINLGNPIDQNQNTWNYLLPT